MVRPPCTASGRGLRGRPSCRVLVRDRWAAPGVEPSGAL